MGTISFSSFISTHLRPCGPGGALQYALSWPASVIGNAAPASRRAPAEVRRTPDSMVSTKSPGVMMRSIDGAISRMSFPTPCKVPGIVFPLVTKPAHPARLRGPNRASVFTSRIPRPIGMKLDGTTKPERMSSVMSSYLSGINGLNGNSATLAMGRPMTSCSFSRSWKVCLMPGCSTATPKPRRASNPAPLNPPPRLLAVSFTALTMLPN